MTEGVVRGRNFEGVEILFGYHRLAIGEGWGVVLGEPWATYQASWSAPLIRLGIGAMVAVALAIAAALVLALARRILAPVQALRRQAEKAAAGRGRTESLAATVSAARIAEFEPLRPAPRRCCAPGRRGGVSCRLRAGGDHLVALRPWDGPAAAGKCRLCHRSLNMISYDMPAAEDKHARQRNGFAG